MRNERGTAQVQSTQIRVRSISFILRYTKYTELFHPVEVWLMAYFRQNGNEFSPCWKADTSWVSKRMSASQENI